VFSTARAEGRAVLVGYLPAGFPTVDRAISACRVMVEAGVDVVELGFPVPDPVMDGPVIRRANAATVAAGVRACDVLATVDAVARTGVPVLLMTYWAPVVERYGPVAFARDLAAAGGAGLITPDLDPGRADVWLAVSDHHDLDRVWVVWPDTSGQDLAVRARHSRGFVYAASVTGVTGIRNRTSTSAPGLVARVRQVTSLPVGVGFGVGDGRQAAEVATYADAVIVGSALVGCLLDAPDFGAGLTALRSLTEDLAAGVRAVSSSGD
jgi:tryptophan synthase alpha chain